MMTERFSLQSRPRPTRSIMLLFSLLVVLQAAIIPPGIDAGHGAPPLIREDVETKFRIPMGQKNFKLVCPVVSGEKELLMVEWLKNGDQVEWDPRYKVAKENKVLIMKNVRLDDSGRYQCQVTNGFGHRTVEFTVHVYDPEDNYSTVKDKLVLSNSSSPPTWLVDMGDGWSSPIQVNRGGRLELRCPARGNPMPEIRWYKNDLLVNTDSPAHIASLVVDPAHPSDSGDYRCVVENRLGSIDAVFKVTVADFFEEKKTISDELSALEPVIDHLYNTTVKSGHTAQFQCKAKAHHQPHIKWLKEVSDPEELQRTDPNAEIITTAGMHLLLLEETQVQPVNRSDPTNQIFINKLIIPRVSKSQAGRYICVVTSPQGHMVWKSAQLIVTTEYYDMTGSVMIWTFVVIGLIAFFGCVCCAICFLRRNQQPTNGKLPPPPKIPIPMAPSSYTPSQTRSLKMENTLEKAIRSPMMLNNTMFKGSATLDRKMHRTQQRVVDDTSHIYDPCSPQPYFSRPAESYVSQQHYRTLELDHNMPHYHHSRPHASCYSDEYAEQQPFLAVFR